ncbi:hypothetical protein [Aurantiacibacter gilvus]|uniref:Uncharacterized protein n=1 Tax=Aurantiacibacter gilvus TaxID=3139141 RepID=A0ABU9IFH1_9SPHN
MSSLTGTWRAVSKTPVGDQHSTLTIVVDGDALTGTCVTDAGATMPLENGKVDGNAATWGMEMTTPFELHMRAAIEVDGDTFSGTMASDFGSSPYSGTREA